MIDIRLIREDPDLVRKTLRDRQMEPDIVDRIQYLDTLRRDLIQQAEDLKAQRNRVSKEIGLMKDSPEKEARKDAMRLVSNQIGDLDGQLREVDTELDKSMAEIPNIPDNRTPYGKGEEDNVVIKQVGEETKPIPNPLPHWELGPELGIINFEQGVKIAGSRFYVLSGAGARLQRALISWMLDLHIRQGYTEKYTPFMVKGETMFASGQLPKFTDNLYKDHEEDLWMVPTSEVPMTGLHMEEILDPQDLPLNYTAYSPCFRREKMSAGRDVRGIKRGHQFDKVEMYIFCEPEQSDIQFEKMVADAEQTCLELGFAYRIKQLCTGDLGFGASITYDIEVWAAGCGEWLEVSSVSNVTDFQARRANIRYRPEGSKRTRFVHTLNGSGLGIPRTLIAVLENNQRADGSVIVPEVLRPWMGGIEIIHPD